MGGRVGGRSVRVAWVRGEWLVWLTGLTPNCLRRGPGLDPDLQSWVEEGGYKWRLYLTLHCHHLDHSCIKMGSDESRFNVSLIVRDKVTIKTVSTDHNL